MKELALDNIIGQFIVPEGLYFLSHSVGCFPKEVSNATKSFFIQWQELGANAWNDWLCSLEEFKKHIGLLLNVDGNEIAIQTNATSGAAKIIQSLPPRKGRDRILLSEKAFPSMGFLAQNINPALYGYELIKEDRSHEEILNNWEKMLTPNIQLVIITHVHSNNSLRYPVKELIEIAKAKQIYTLIDVTASVGICEIDLKKWGADFVVGSCIKWLCGGAGAGFLWVNKLIIDFCAPKTVGWFSHKDPFEFDINNFEYAQSSNRFMDGTPSILPYVIANKSLQVLHKIRLEMVIKYNRLLCKRFIQGLSDLKIKISSPLNQEERGGTVVFCVNDTNEHLPYLNKKKLHVDKREFGYRFSPHIYNSYSEIDDALNIISKLLS
jgi:selenocysteine lyase/cysteine desulfurase